MHMTAQDRYQALVSVNTVIDRLTAWRDNAKIMLTSCLPADEQRWQNEYDNYAYLVACLNVTKGVIDAQ